MAGPSQTFAQQTWLGASKYHSSSDAKGVSSAARVTDVTRRRSRLGADHERRRSNEDPEGRCLKSKEEGRATGSWRAESDTRSEMAPKWAVSD